MFPQVQKGKRRKTKLISIEIYHKGVGYYSGARKANLTSKDYLEFLDGKLGIPQGTIYNLCVAATKSIVESKEGDHGDLSGSSHEVETPRIS